MPVHCRARNEGNALFLILIAVALFAALSYAITQSGRGSGGTNREQAALLAAQVVATANSVKQGVTRMILTGTPATSITCMNTAGGSDCGAGSLNAGGKSFCTTGATCLFAPTGGDVTIPIMPQAAFDFPTSGFAYASRFAGANSYQGLVIDGFNSGADSSVGNIGTSANDDIAWTFGLRQDVCLAINRGFGLSAIPDIADTWDPMPGVDGLESACVDSSTTAYGYVYYQVLNAN